MILKLVGDVEEVIDSFYKYIYKIVDGYSQTLGTTMD